MRKKLVFCGMLCMIFIYGMMEAENWKKTGQICCSSSIDEMVSKLECTYKIMLIPGREVWDYGELGELPDGVFEVSFYMLEGNKLLFLPEGKGNTEIELNGFLHEAYYSDMEDKYLFYAVMDWGLEEKGVPVNYCGNSRITYLPVGIKEKKDYSLDDLNWVGKAEIDFSDGSAGDLPNIRVMENEYMNVVLDEISGVLKEKQKYGDYDVYIGGFKRISEKYGDTSCLVDCVVDGNGIKEYACFVVYDTGDIGGVFSLSGPHFQNTGYFTDMPGKDDGDLISKIIDQGCEPVHLEVREKMAQRSNGFAVERVDGISTMDFRNMLPEDLAGQIGNLCSYCEWYGMKELGCQEGRTEELDGKKVAMYLWNNSGDTLFFIPLDEANAILQGKDSAKCPVCLDENGNMVFYKMETNPYVNIGCLKTTFIMKEEFPSEFMEYFTKLGEEKIEVKSFPDLGFRTEGEDEYTQALRKHVEELLRENGKQGRYDIYMGEYEAVGVNKVCMSAAVIGEEKYYVRYLAVKYGEGDYYFWPVGFGLDGSLEECASEKHRMNEICIERVRQLSHK